MKRLFYLLVFFIGTLSRFNAQFSHEAGITGFTKSGLYKLPLYPGVRQYMSSNLHDVRICDSAGKEVPYVLLSEAPLKSKSDFMEYPILSQQHLKDHSKIIIHNTYKNTISNIAFNINNSDAHKYCSIEGSDDLEQWYSLSSLQELSLIYNNQYANTYKCIYFPLSDYKYFKLLVEDWHSEPLKINYAGYFKNSVIAGKLSPILFSKIQTEDTAQKITTIRLTSANSQAINRIDFKVKSPRLFMRHATAYLLRARKTKYKTEQYKETIFEFDLNSNTPLVFDVLQLNTKEFFIDIDNKDNPPLQIDSITCKQLASYLVFDADANNTYTLKCGNMALKLPQYDLVNFVSATPQVLPEASIKDFKRVFAATPAKQAAIEKPKQKSFYETRDFIWICLGFAALVIFWFSRNLLRDMNKDEK